MATEAQIEANRCNALKSTGPRTENGKKVTRLNAYRHGLTGQIEVVTRDEKEARDKFFAEIVSGLAPANAMENQFAYAVADGHWRLNRISSIESNLFTMAAIPHMPKYEQDCSEESSTEDPGGAAWTSAMDQGFASAMAFVEDSTRFQLLTTYEARIHRNMSKSLKQLTDLQATRRAAEAEHATTQNTLRQQALEEASLHCRLAEMEGVPCDPATDYPDPNGFVFSSAEIAQSIRRISHLKAARQAESSGWTPVKRRAA